jgi:alkylated DNA repair protein (DNA oxidative demethylase)
VTLELFAPDDHDPEALDEGVWLLRRRALPEEAQLCRDLGEVARTAPFRHMVTPGGHTMSVAMTNCGPLGWVTDRRGYRYVPRDPESNRPWPSMPEAFANLARAAAAESGFASFAPDACLINRYQVGAKMGLHQDKDEECFDHPIVSVSLGLPAVFQLGGFQRSEKVRRVHLQHGDVLVWGGPARLRYHGILPLKEGSHPLGPYRFNLTFRRARA